jgi:peptidoglycan hydrolase-like protein with peptidoglycan-binding domain
VDYLQAYRWLDRAAASYPPGDKRDKAVRNRDLALSLMTPAQMAQVPLRTHHVAAAQAALQRLGYDPGPADGLVGPRTQEAVKAFQRDRGLPETGELTHELIQLMSKG